MAPVTTSVGMLLLIGLAGVVVGLLLGFSLGRVSAMRPDKGAPRPPSS